MHQLELVSSVLVIRYGPYKSGAAYPYQAYTAWPDQVVRPSRTRLVRPSRTNLVRAVPLEANQR